MSDIEKTLLRKKAANIRARMRRGVFVSDSDRQIVEEWERKRSPRGKKSFYKAAESNAPEPTENPDEHDTEPTVETPREAPEPVIEDPPAEEPAEAFKASPPPPPRVSARSASKSDKHWRAKYEQSSGGGTREQTCRFVVSMALQKLALPCIELHRQHGIACPVNESDLIPKDLGNGNEQRPVVFDDGVVAADEFLPKDIVTPPGLVFGVTMGMLWWSTWKLKKTIEAQKGYVRPTTVDVESVEQTPTAPPVETEVKPQNGAGEAIARLF